MSSTSSRSSRSIHSAAAPIERPLETAANRYGGEGHRHRAAPEVAPALDGHAVAVTRRHPPRPSRQRQVRRRSGSSPCHVVQSDRTDHPGPVVRRDRGRVVDVDVALAAPPLDRLADHVALGGRHQDRSRHSRTAGTVRPLDLPECVGPTTSTLWLAQYADPGTPLIPSTSRVSSFRRTHSDRKASAWRGPPGGQADAEGRSSAHTRAPTRPATSATKTNRPIRRQGQDTRLAVHRVPGTPGSPRCGGRGPGCRARPTPHSGGRRRSQQRGKEADQQRDGGQRVDGTIQISSTSSSSRADIPGVSGRRAIGAVSWPR